MATQTQQPAPIASCGSVTEHHVTANTVDISQRRFMNERVACHTLAVVFRCPGGS